MAQLKSTMRLPTRPSAVTRPPPESSPVSQVVATFGETPHVGGGDSKAQVPFVAEYIVCHRCNLHEKQSAQVRIQPVPSVIKRL